MNKGDVITTIIFAGLLAACGHDHDGHDHDHEGHDHAAEMAKHEDSEHHHEGAITLDEHQAELFGVKSERLFPGEFSEVIRVSGAIEPSSTDRVTITATRSGIFTLASGVTVGGSISSGGHIGTISSRGLQGGDPNAVAAATLEATRREMERLTPLFKDGLVTESVYNEAVKAYNEAKASQGGVAGGSSSVVSPAAGVIAEVFVSSGGFVEVGTPVALVVRNSRLTLRADVPERYISSVPAFVSANFRPDCSSEVFSLRELGGQPLSPGNISPARGGYVPVYFTFNGNGKIVPGSYAEVYLTGRPREGVLTVPREALIEMQGNYYAYVRLHDHDDVYEKRLVTIGASDGLRVEVLEGLKENEEVVVKGASIVRMAETSAIAPPGHTHNH